MQTETLPPAVATGRPPIAPHRPPIATYRRAAAVLHRPGRRVRAHPYRHEAIPSPRLLHRARLAALGVGGFLLPWSVLLAVTLPHTTRVQHWSVAWAGLDTGEAIAALATAALLARADKRAALTAAAGGALLLADAWFDICTSSPGAAQAVAVIEALFAELPLAGGAFWLALTLTRDTW